MATYRESRISNTDNAIAVSLSYRVKNFEECLNAEVIDLKRLNDLCFSNGCPDDKHNRSLSWKLLLGYLPSDKREWKKFTDEKRQLYRQFVSELIIGDSGSAQSPDDHPLNPAPTSSWTMKSNDNEILQQIYKDVRRLYPDISFFQQRTAKSYGSKSLTCDMIGRATSKASSIDVVRNRFGATEVRDNVKRRISDDEDFNDDTEEYHWQIVARILFVYAKLNPGQGYVQGMNEIIGPIFYVFANDTQDGWNVDAEADTFWCFTALMSEIRDVYNSHADGGQTGIVSLMTKLTTMLSHEDSELYHQITQVQSIKPHYYAFRWITLLLSQEFPLPEVLRLWDFLFSDEHRFLFLIQISCAMIMLLRDELLAGDFASNMKLLQNFPDHIDVNTVINKAKELRGKR